MAERLREGIGRLMVPGVTQRLPGETPDSAMQRVDRALYRAKAAGRYRVEAAA